MRWHLAAFIVLVSCANRGQGDRVPTLFDSTEQRIESPKRARLSLLRVTENGVSAAAKSVVFTAVGSPEFLAHAAYNSMVSRRVIGDGSISVLAPRMWKCDATIGADGSEAMKVIPQTTGPAPSKLGQAVNVEAIPACQGCIAALVCPLFPSVLRSWPELACEKSPPKELVMHPNATTAFFEDPPGVSGVGDPSGGAYPANGVLIYSGTSENGAAGSAAKMTCTLPESDHALCTVVLNDFLRK